MRRFPAPGAFAVPAGMAICAFPFVSTGAGLLLGLVLALAFGNPWLDRTRRVTSKLLALSIVGLGAGMDLRVVARVGAHGILYTVAGIATALPISRPRKIGRNCLKEDHADR